jgi:hypothetical protein
VQEDHRPGAALSQANPLPFAPVPYDLLKDPGLTPTDKLVAGLILEWLHLRPSGWVFNGILAKSAGIKKRALQYSLQKLKARGWYRYEVDPGNRSRRRIVAMWRSGERATACTPTDDDASRCTLAMHGSAPSGMHVVALKEESGIKNRSCLRVDERSKSLVYNKLSANMLL